MVRCHAHLLPAELYDQREAHLVSGLRYFDQSTMADLVADGDGHVELLSGEWRRLFAAAEGYRKIISPKERRARLLVPPESTGDFIELLRGIEQNSGVSPLVLGAAKLLRILQRDQKMRGVVFLEETDAWEAQGQHAEIIALRPEVFSSLQDDIRTLQEQGELAMLRRLFDDHCDAEIEFSPENWSRLRGDARIQAPELIAVLNEHYTTPEDFTVMRELLAMVGNAQTQPSLDAWLRVHGDAAQYALYFHAPPA